MSDKKVNVTLKAGAGYDAPWITIGGDSAEEVLALLQGVESTALLAAVVGSADEFYKAHLAAGGISKNGQQVPQAAPAQQPAPQWQPPAASPQANPWQGQQQPAAAQQGGVQWQNGVPYCRHGAMQGANKSTGKEYRNWFCPSRNENDKCPQVPKGR